MASRVSKVCFGRLAISAFGFFATGNPEAYGLVHSPFGLQFILRVFGRDMLGMVACWGKKIAIF